MIRTQLSRLSACIGLPAALLVAPAIHAQTPTPPKFINGSTCVFDSSQTGLSLLGPYLRGAAGTAYCNFAPPAHVYGQPVPQLNSVAISGFTQGGGRIAARVCQNLSFAGQATVYCGPERISSGDFYDLLELPPTEPTPTGYFVQVTVTPPFGAVSGLSVVWVR